jgi:hypothetical protein
MKRLRERPFAACSRMLTPNTRFPSAETILALAAARVEDAVPGGEDRAPMSDKAIAYRVQNVDK